MADDVGEALDFVIGAAKVDRPLRHRRFQVGIEQMQAVSGPCQVAGIAAHKPERPRADQQDQGAADEQDEAHRGQGSLERSAANVEKPIFGVADGGRYFADLKDARRLRVLLEARPPGGNVARESERHRLFEFLQLLVEQSPQLGNPRRLFGIVGDQFGDPIERFRREPHVVAVDLQAIRICESRKPRRPVSARSSCTSSFEISSTTW